tara:strand:+ start:643 stop:1683 length:1041 start_codon:yes stop_codon:yes gene_type:complete
MKNIKQRFLKKFFSFVITLIYLSLTFTLSFADTLTISIWGGGYGNMWKKHAADPFEKETGHKVIIDGGRSSERLSKLIATKGKGTDLIFLTDYQMAIANEKGLLTQINKSNVKSMSNLYEFAKDPLGGGLCPAITVIGAGLAYNKNHFSTPPTSWNALFNKNLKGKPGYPAITQSYSPLVLIRIAEMYGGNINSIDKGFSKLAEIKDRVQIFKLFEILDSINQGDASVTPMLNIFVRKDPSVPLSFTWPKDGGIGILNMACVIKGTKKKELAEQFLDFYLSDRNQSHMAQNGGDSPVNKNVPVPKGTKYTMVTEDQVSKLHFYDATIVASKRDGWLTKFQEEIIAE